MIVTLSCLLAIQTGTVGSDEYLKPIFVHELPNDELSDHIEVRSLTTGGMVAGSYLDISKRRSGKLFQRAFIWRSGTFTLLPSGKYNYTRAYAATDSMVVGSVDSDFSKGPFPAVWKPDEIKGWSKPVLSWVGQDIGLAVDAHEDGTLWIHTDKLHRIRGETDVSFDLKGELYAGSDLLGRIFTTYTVTHTGPWNAHSKVLHDGNWTTLSPEAANSHVTDVNLGGQAIGTADGDSVLWQFGKPPEVIEDQSDLTGYTAAAINNRGMVVGTMGFRNTVRPSDSYSLPFVWKDGAMKILGARHSKPRLSSAVAINDKGWILAKEETPEKIRFFLLKPRG